MVNREKLERYIKLMSSCNSGDWEVDHGNADDTLCMLLEELGYGKVVEVFDKVGKWYA